MHTCRIILKIIVIHYIMTVTLVYYFFMFSFGHKVRNLFQSEEDFCLNDSDVDEDYIPNKRDIIRIYSSSDDSEHAEPALPWVFSFSWILTFEKAQF